MQRLVLLPGMDGTGHLFRQFVEQVPENLEAVTVRYPTDVSLSYSELLDFVRTACEGPEQFVLVAESFSTPLAIQYAATNPRGLKGLVLCAGFASNPVHLCKRLLGLLFAPILVGLPVPEFAVKLWLVGADAPHSLVDSVRSAISTVAAKVLVARVRAVFACDARAELRRVAAPILYIQAKRDRLVPAKCLEDIQQIQPRTTVVAIESPHSLLQREPEKVFKAIAWFIQQLR